MKKHTVFWINYLCYISEISLTCEAKNLDTQFSGEDLTGLVSGYWYPKDQ